MHDNISPIAETLSTYDQEMATENVVEFGQLLADATRVALLDALFDGRAYTVTELHRHVGVAASTASEHLSKLLDGGLVVVEAQGRHRYYRMKDAEVASVLEAVFEFGGGQPVKRSSKVPADLAYARSCYDHLAGTVAVGLTDHLVDKGLVEYIDTAAHLTSSGEDLFSELGFVTKAISGRPALRRCLDWSERKTHLAGGVPAQLLDIMIEQRWFLRSATRRGLQLTDTGRAGLIDQFGYHAP